MNMKLFASTLALAGLLVCACSDSDDPPGEPPPGGSPDAGGPPPPLGDAPPDGDERFLTAPPADDCSAQVAANWEPIGGFSGGIFGRDVCGPSSPNCPTTYVAGNSGSACSSAGDCTGLDPVCLDGPKYPGGSCSATGCELGSNFGCPEGAVCIDSSTDETYCVGGCGIDQSGCFVHCARSDYACFTTESSSLGICLGVEGVRQCNPSATNRCTVPEFGLGVCVQTSWDDQTVGRCFEICDPLAQDCSGDDEGCYLLREYDRTAVCFQSWGFPEGTRCSRMTQCAEGLRCACDSPDFDACRNGESQMFCREYCAMDGTVTCPSDRVCRAIHEGGNLGSCQLP
jgi:hypothetical protein